MAVRQEEEELDGLATNEMIVLSNSQRGDEHFAVDSGVLANLTLGVRANTAV
jgi:hypothetical protein